MLSVNVSISVCMCVYLETWAIIFSRDLSKLKISCLID